MEWLARGLALPVCPEELGGLPSPRPPCELRSGRIVDALGNDHTEAFVSGCKLGLEAALAAGCREAVLKARSPSCGVGEIYDGAFSRRLTKGNGLFAQALMNVGISVRRDEDV